MITSTRPQGGSFGVGWETPQIDLPVHCAIITSSKAWLNLISWIQEILFAGIRIWKNRSSEHVRVAVSRWCLYELILATNGFRLITKNKIATNLAFNALSPRHSLTRMALNIMVSSLRSVARVKETIHTARRSGSIYTA